MKELHFSTSVRMATDFAARELLYPGRESKRHLEQPAWSGLGWFSRITAGPIAKLKPENPEREAIIDYWLPVGEVVERYVDFYMGSYLVAMMILRGVRKPGEQPSCWSVAAVRYHLDTVSPEEKWVRHDYLALTFSNSGAPGESAPEE